MLGLCIPMVAGIQIDANGVMMVVLQAQGPSSPLYTRKNFLARSQLKCRS